MYLPKPQPVSHSYQSETMCDSRDETWFCGLTFLVEDAVSRVQVDVLKTKEERLTNFIPTAS